VDDLELLATRHEHVADAGLQRREGIFNASAAQV
jgi:hypothetical protein